MTILIYKERSFVYPGATSDLGGQRPSTKRGFITGEAIRLLRTNSGKKFPGGHV